MKTSQPLLIMFLGVPGSGKSYFARHLAKRINAVRLNGDSMRIAIWGSLDEIAKAHGDRNKGNDMTFGAINYAVDQILATKHSVVYDAHHNRRDIRKKLEEMAKRQGAQPIVVWVKTPKSIAMKRAQAREATVDQRRMSEEEIREVIARHMKYFDEPDQAENVIIIDGTADFETQFESYKEQVAQFV
jgi:predicted kinase